MESNRFYYRLFKYGFLLLGIILLLTAVGSLIKLESITINGEHGTVDIYTTIVLFSLGILLILLFLLLKDKFVLVHLTNQTLKITHKRQETTCNWFEVEHLTQVQFIIPPLYKIKLKYSNRSLLFNTDAKYFSFSGFVRDLSEMGTLIRNKKSELRI